MAKKREQETTDGIRRDLETSEGLLPGQPQTQPDQPQQGPQQAEEQDEGPERINRMEAAYWAIRAMDGDSDTLSHLAKVADELFVAGYEGDEEYSDVDAATWKVRQVLEHLEGLGLVELSWECVVTPLIDLSNVKAKSK